MYLDFNFKPDRKKLVTYTAVALFWTLALALLIYTSWYQNDFKMTKAFGDVGYNNKILYWISDYIVNEGYFTLTTFTIPLGIILFESFLIYFKKHYPQKKWAMFFVRSKRFFEYSLIVSWTGFMFLVANFVFYEDRGFGVLFNPKTFNGQTYHLVTGIMVLVINNIILWSLSLYVMYRLTLRPEFEYSNYWKGCIYFTIYTVTMYLIIIFLKTGLQRPLFYQIIFDDLLKDLKIRDYETWSIYMSQIEINYGWNDGIAYDLESGFRNTSWKGLKDSPTSWEWWKAYTGGFLFNAENPINVNFFKLDQAFPSGHLETGASFLIAMVALTSQPNKKYSHQRVRGIKTFGKVMGIGYIIAMFFGLGFTYGHWMSDMAFTLVLGVPIHFVALYLTRKVIQSPLQKFHQKTLIKTRSLDSEQALNPQFVD